MAAPAQDDLPHPVWSGSFMIGDVEMRCHVLSTGQRIIEAECVEAFFASTAPLSEADMVAFARWTKGLDR